MPADLTVGQFVYVIRKRIKLSPEKAIFIFVDEVLPPTAALMSSIYEEHKDDDGYVCSLSLSPFRSCYCQRLLPAGGARSERDSCRMMMALLTSPKQIPLHPVLGREHVWWL